MFYSYVLLVMIITADMVIATEMTRHFEHLSKFVNSINKRRTSRIGEVKPVVGDDLIKFEALRY